ncbi:hypothetical protein SAMN05661091_5160 [Paenibacillus uliginis N3/975]|uniref:YpzG-like protein n=1 Tax=Paenibacillus uliginis N3/975 TaxID=1313296 RepID=A0A1X7HPK8_9BACL|nr:hypothetical protein [Paenibacillus uliginis]SMF90645.1 hypothetical protein SAMN05661091_5160 [Paenibacillus uliginis N3/975]
MLTVHTMVPFHHQYPRPQTVNTIKREQTGKKRITFHEILKQKMKEKTTKR